MVVGVILLLVCMSIQSSGRVMDKFNPLSVEGNTLYVGGSGPNNYTKIQDAIDNASDGDTVFVYNGTYVENIWVSKSIDLIGENRETTIIDGNNHDSVVDILADKVNINRFTIQNSVGKPFETGGIRLHSISSNISHNIFSNNYVGIFVYQSDNNIIYQNIISNGWIGISIESDSGYIFILENSIISNNLGIVTYQDTRHIIVAYNFILDNNEGIFFSGALSTIMRNTISNNLYGITSHSNAFNDVWGNNIMNNTVNARYKYGIREAFRLFGKTIWIGNYWGILKQRPVPIWGGIGIIFCLIPWFPQFDWHPAKEPYDIEV